MPSDLRKGRVYTVLSKSTSLSYNQNSPAQPPLLCCEQTEHRLKANTSCYQSLKLASLKGFISPGAGLVLSEQVLQGAKTHLSPVGLMNMEVQGPLVSQECFPLHP